MTTATDFARTGFATVDRDDDWWQAVLDRDSRRAGEFIIAVRTTRIFCRPGCPARVPHRANVEFFATASEAQRAGYRACLRCRPLEPGRVDVAIVGAALRRFETEERFPGTRELAESAGVSDHVLRSAFQRILGVTPKVAWEQATLERARSRLQDGSDVAGAIYDAGFGSSRGFYEAAGRSLGMAPVAYRRHGAGEAISWTIVDTSLGSLLVATTTRGVCAVRFGHRETLEAEFRAEFANAAISTGDTAVAAVAAAIAGAVEGQVAALDLPLDLRGTAFQLRVWAALREIPRGELRSYTDVAVAIGQPSAVRAVARACASNPVAIAVPCHRVIASDGGLSGYRWGIERKRALIEREGAPPDGSPVRGM